MDFAPVELVRPVKLNEVAGPAIVLPAPGREEAFLVTGGEQQYVCFIGGSYVGDGFPKEAAVRWSGLAIENVRFEVDVSSAFKPAFIDQPLGALIRSGTELFIYIGTQDGHGFKDAARVPLIAPVEASSTDIEIGFRKWRAVVGETPNTIVVFTFEAIRTANV